MLYNATLTTVESGKDPDYDTLCLLLFPLCILPLNVIIFLISFLSPHTFLLLLLFFLFPSSHLISFALLFVKPSADKDFQAIRKI